MEHTITLQFEDGVTRFIGCRSGGNRGRCGLPPKIQYPARLPATALAAPAAACESGSSDMPERLH